jgi:tetratricopeptide (TPR) repeat protein
LRLLGDVAIARAGEPPRRLRPTKYVYLLAFLAINPEKPYSRERLVDIFWPDMDVEQGRSCLRTALSTLRHRLDCPTLFASDSPELVKLSPSVLETDVARFKAAVYGRDPQAPRLYEGEFLPGCYLDWANDERIELERVYEESVLLAAPIPGRSPRTAAPGPSLPRPLTTFCGREREIGTILKTVSDHRLTTLVGLGGIGKTRIAIELGWRLSESYRPVFVALSKIENAFEFAGPAADAVGIERAPSETFDARFLEAIDRWPSLLILDNLEHVLEERTIRDWLEALLAKAPSVKVLATSRVPLGVEGERIVPIESLSANDAREMFLDRARSVQPSFPDSDYLADLCDRLDRIPLAIVLCAARANVLSAAGMLKTLDDHRGSLRAVLEWACPEDDPLHRALVGASVFRGGWSIEAAQAVLGDPSVDLLAALRSRSLIRLEVGEEENRFFMLDVVRDYAEQTAPPNLLREVRESHCRYFLSLCEHLVRLHSQDEWGSFSGIDLESTNIFLAFEWGLQAEPELELHSLKTLGLSEWCLWVRGYHGPLGHLVELIAARLELEASPEIEAYRLRFSGVWDSRQGQMSLALDRFERAAALFESLGILDETRMALKQTCNIHTARRDYAAAEASIRRQLDLLESGGEVHRAIILAEQAHLSLLQSRFDEALDLYRELREFWTPRSLSVGHLAMIDRGTATCFAAQGKVEEAIPLLESSIQIYKSKGLKFWEMKAWSELAELYARIGDEAASATARAHAAG